MARDEPTEGAVERIDAADPRWAAYVEGRRDASLYQHPAWLRCLAREYRSPGDVVLAAVDAAGALRGVLPLRWTRGLPAGPPAVVGRRLASLPRTPVAGPLAGDEATAAALLAAAAAEAGADGRASLQVKLARPLPAEAAPAGGALHPWRESFVVELPEREEDLRFGPSRNHSRIRWAVNRARREGVTVREAADPADVRAFHALYLEALRANAVPPRPLRLFEAMWDELRPLGAFTLLLAEDRDRTPIAGAVVLALGDTAYYAFNGVRRDALDLRPNDLVQWEAIHAAVRAGRRRYDLGEVPVARAGLADFKRKWGAEAVVLQRLYLPAPEAPPTDGGEAEPRLLRRAVEAAYRRAPLPVTAAVGDRLYRYL